MYTLTRKLSVVCLTVVLSFLVYGCGGSSKQALITDVSTEMVTAGLTPDAGTYNIQPGGTANAGDVAFVCSAEGSSCEVTVADDGTVTSAGGMATAMDSTSAAARLAALEAARLAGIAQEAAERERDAALEAARLAGIAQDTAEEAARLAGIAQDTAEEAARLAGIAQDTAEGDRDDAEEAARLAGIAKDDAEEAARLAGIAQDTAEGDRDDALEAARLAGIAKDTAEGERDDALEEARLANLRANPHSVDTTTLDTNHNTITADTYQLDPGGKMNVDDATFYCPADGLACEIKVADDGTVTSAGGMATAQNSMAAKTTIMAIALSATDGALDTPATAPTAPLNTIDNPIGVERSPDGVTTITLSHAADVDAGYTKAVDTGHEINGWMGQTLQRDNGIAATDLEDAEPATTMDKATIYTNIAAAVAGTWEITGAELPSTTSGEATHMVFAIDPGQEDDAFEEAFMGSYIRADSTRIHGTFTCNTATGAPACTEVMVPSMTNANGNLELLTQLATGWTFESDDNVKEGETPDADYLYFGYWLSSPVETSDTVAGYQFAAYSSGNLPFTVLPALTALGVADALKATYEGGAAGRYVTRDLDIVGGTVDPNSPGSHGRFTAKAELVAYFGTHADVDEVEVTNSIGGTITEFKDGEKDLGFDVTLVRTELIPNDDNIGSSATTTATFGNNDADGAGSWTATFYGAAADDDMDTREAPENKLPSGVAGQFDVNSPEGYTRVVGAYAAEKK